ncbi:MAG: hypothetical protein D6723_00495 [Acidobacteria bacterium]|nr:MAG: hypothetical protein D6723_00495 [Acidobacteriota bacterium]
MAGREVMLIGRCKRAVCCWIGWWLGLVLMAPTLVQAEQLPIKTYTTADGLGSDFIQRIVRDSRGFLWFCTRDGLSRFDGRRFVTYTMEQGLSDPTINDLLETHDGVYWVATNGGGVCRFNPDPIENQKAKGKDPQSAIHNLFTIYPVGDEPATNRVNVLYEDRAGRLWAGTDGGLFCLDQTSDQAVFRCVELGLPSHPDHLVGVAAFVEDREGSLWIGTSWGLVRRSSDGRMVHYPVHPVQGTDRVTTLLIDREGRLWVGHEAGLLVLQPDFASIANQKAKGKRQKAESEPLASEIHIQTSTIRKAGDVRWYTTADGLVHNRVLALHQTSDGRIWIATAGGLTEYDGQRFRRYTTAQGLSNKFVWQLAEDCDGNLWMGTRSGAMKLTLNGFTTYDETDGLGHTRIHAIFENPAGALFVVSGNWCINRFDGERFTSVEPKLPEDATYSWASQVGFLDRAGQWWLLTTKGLYRFAKVGRLQQLAHERPLAIYTRRDGLAGDRPFRLFEDSHGDIWVGTRGEIQGGLARWDHATGTFHRYTEADGLPPTKAPSAFSEARSGAVWIGFYDGGLARYQEGRFTLFTVMDGVPAGMITTLYLDRAGRLWIGSNQGGLGRLDDPGTHHPRFLRYTIAQGLSSNNVRCLTEDRWGRIYLGTVRGVDRLDPATGHIKHYTINDGLANSFVTVAFRDRHGALWFGTQRGLSRLVPQPSRPPSPPPIWIGGLRIAGVSQPVSELGEVDISGLELGSDQNQLHIDFFSLGFAAGEVLRYQYKLEGADRDWSTTDQRSVNYANLSAGDYRFLVRAVSADGQTSPTPAAVAFTILPPVWQRWWFLALAVIFGGVMVYAIHHYRLAHLLELERVRTRIATDLHDDIGSSLSRIVILSEVVKQEIGTTHQGVVQRLTEVAETARELVDTMSDIVWSIDPQRDDLKNVIARIRRFASDVLGVQGIGWKFQTPPEPEKVKLTPEQRRHIFLIFKEAIHNIVRHADCTFVSLTIHVAGGRLVAEIHDDGRGFLVPATPELIRQDRPGHGLESMRARAAALGGQLHIDSAPGRGTHLILSIPLK